MQFVRRSSCPKLLKEKQADWTVPWMAYYRSKNGLDCERVSRPSSSHWLLDDIRLPLIKDFHNNCGYCGQSLPTPQNSSASKGDVDHYLPQVEYPDQVYEWTNYIWSCKPCNQQKLTFHSVVHPLLNPCCKEDCAHLQFIEDTGEYTLKDSVANDVYWQQRLCNSEQKTCLNTEEICHKRRFEISTLRKRFESIAENIRNIDNVSMLQNKESNGRIIAAIKTMEGQICSDIEEILTITRCLEFYFLMEEQYQNFRQDYPKISGIIKKKQRGKAIF